jgi:hypothetical protein
MNIGLVNSVSSTSEVKSVKNTAYSQQTSKVDYSNYSIADLRKIPYEEAKVNFDAIMNRSLELDTGEASAKELSGLSAQLFATKVTENDNFKKSLYNTLQNIENGPDAFVAYGEVMQNLKEYASGIQDIKPSFMVNDNFTTYKEPTRTQINSIDFSDFISKMINEVFDSSNAKGEVKKQYQNIADAYITLQKSYENEVRKPYYA